MLASKINTLTQAQRETVLKVERLGANYTGYNVTSNYIMFEYKNVKINVYPTGQITFGGMSLGNALLVGAAAEEFDTLE